MSMKLQFDSRHSYIAADTDQSFFRAEDMNLERTVFIKKTELCGETPKEKKNAYEEAMRQVKVMIRVENEWLPIPKVYDVFHRKEDDTLWIVMQYVPGKTMRESEISNYIFIQKMKELCDILIVLGKHGIYHKDIKPENLILDQNMRLWLIDFDISLNTSNPFEGTPLYKAPEMNFGSRYADRSKADIFSIGVMLYEKFTGKIPVSGIDYWEGEGKQWGGFTEPKKINPDISNELNSLIINCMKYDCHERYNLRQLQSGLKKIRI